MSVIKLVEPDEAYDYIIDNMDRLKYSIDLIASHENFGVEIYMTAYANLEISVTVDGTEVHCQEVEDKEDICDVLQEIYDKYLTNDPMKLIESVDDDDDEDDTLASLLGFLSNNEAEIEDREENLDSIFAMLIAELADEATADIDDMEEMLQDVKEHMCEYVARKWGVPVYRPMYLEDVDTGKEFYSEYPYSEMEFDDPDNPIYKP